MPNLLTELRLTELSLVDRPANPEAYAPIFKADFQEGDNDQMEDEVIKMSDDMKEKLKPYMDKGMSTDEALKAYGEDMKAAADTAKGEVEKLRKFLLEEGYEIGKESIQKKAEEDYIEFEGEKVSKSDDRFELVKRLKEAEDEKAFVALEKKASETLPNIEPKQAVTLMKTAEEIDDEDFLNFLIAIDNLFGKSFEEEGSSNADTTLLTAKEKMEGLVTKHMKENSVSKAKAYNAVMKTDEGKELYKMIDKET